MNRKYLQRSVLIGAMLVLAGCSTSSPSHYISPRITGRVVDAKSGQPVETVQVRTIGNNERAQAADTAKGAERMTRTSAFDTKPDGTFVIPSEKEVAFFRAVGWYSVTLSFEHPAYYKTVKTYMPKNATNSASGEPWIQTGDISVDPLPK